MSWAGTTRTIKGTDVKLLTSPQEDGSEIVMIADIDKFHKWAKGLMDRNKQLDEDKAVLIAYCKGRGLNTDEILKENKYV
jgi:hypothetical protein